MYHPKTWKSSLTPFSPSTPPHPHLNHSTSKIHPIYFPLCPHLQPQSRPPHLSSRLVPQPPTGITASTHSPSTHSVHHLVMCLSCLNSLMALLCHYSSPSSAFLFVSLSVSLLSPCPPHPNLEPTSLAQHRAHQSYSCLRAFALAIPDTWIDLPPDLYASISFSPFRSHSNPTSARGFP